jgi:hypothetical protein
MALPKFTLAKNKGKDRWDLTNDTSDKVVKSFERKSDATKGGVLSKAIGPGGGSIKIQKVNRRFGEERTFPRNKDPRFSKG